MFYQVIYSMRAVLIVLFLHKFRQFEKALDLDGDGNVSQKEINGAIKLLRIRQEKSGESEIICVCWTALMVFINFL